MVKNPDTPDKIEWTKYGNSENRRDFLKRVGVAGTVATVGTAATAGTAAAYQETNYADRVRDDNIYVRNTETIRDKSGIAKCAVLQGSFLNATGDILHQIDTAARSIYKRDYKNISGGYESQKLLSHSVEIRNRKPGSSTLFTPDNPRDVGARPRLSGGTSAGYGDAAFTAVKGAIGLLSPPAGVVVVATDVVDKLSNNNESGGQDSVRYNWDYNNAANGYSKLSPIDHYASFYIETKQSEVRYSVTDRCRVLGGNQPTALGVIYTIRTQISSSSDVEADSQILSQDQIPDDSVLSDFADGGELRRVSANLETENTDSRTAVMSKE